MVIVVRDHHPGLVQGRRPGELAPRLVARRGGGAVEQVERELADPARLAQVDVEAPLQLAHRGVAQVLAAGATLGRLARREVEDHALSQGAARRLELGDAEVGGERVEDGEAAADDGAAIVLQARQRELVGVAGLEALLHQPAQAGRRDAAVADAARGEHLRDRADGARRAERLAPVARRERLERFLELGAGGDLRLAEAALAEAAVGEVLDRQADAADRNDSAWRGRVPRPRIISVERPPMSMTRRGTVDGCSRATPAKMRRASSRPETISTGWPRTVCARSRKASRFLASRSVCVATARTWCGAKPSEAPCEAGQAVQRRAPPPPR
jgi:hypothetical protein